jgi:hypothetical protein
MAKKKVVVVGGGWAGTGAAISAAKAGADVTLLERTDLLLGTGLAGGYLRNNGRFTAAEEMIAMGAGELFNCMDTTATNGKRNVEMPHHKHGTVYNVFEIEPLVRNAVLNSGAKILFQHRFTDVVMDGNVIKAVQCANDAVIEADVFVDSTGTTGSEGNCRKYGSGCCCCVLRCPTFGVRVGVAGRAGVRERSVKRPDGKRGAYSGACEVPKECVDPALRKKLEENSSLVIPLPPELINTSKLTIKACQQYASKEYAENLVILDNGYFKLVTPFFPIEKLRHVPGFERARFEDPYSGGVGNSIRYLAIGECDNALQAKGPKNLFLAGEKAGTYVGHTEAICTGTLAGRNAARLAVGQNPVALPAKETALGGAIAIATKTMAEEGEDLDARFTFAGESVFAWMKESGIYSTDPAAVKARIDKAGLTGYFNKPVA